MSNVSTLAMGVAMIAALVLLGGGVKLALGRQTRARGILMIVGGAGPRYERDDLDGIAGFTGSVASRMSR